MNFENKKSNNIQFQNDVIIKHSFIDQAISSASSSQMYNNIGIKTPNIQIIPNKSYSEQISTTQPNIYSVKDSLCTLANDDLVYSKLKTKIFGKYKWQMFYDELLMKTFLSFMTPQCLEQLQNVFLIDELRTDIDRHTKNYFFYKNKNSSKYEGIIAIDLEQMIIYNYCGTSKQDFYSFLFFPYASVTPQQVNDELCYCDRVKNIRKLIADEKLSKNNIETLVAALKFDFPKSIKEQCKQQKIHHKDKNKILTPIDRLWEYNNQTIGKDLGL